MSSEQAPEDVGEAEAEGAVVVTEADVAGADDSTASAVADAIGAGEETAGALPALDVASVEQPTIGRPSNSQKRTTTRGSTVALIYTLLTGSERTPSAMAMARTSWIVAASLALLSGR